MTILQLSWVKVLMYKVLRIVIRMLSESMLNKYNGIRIHFNLILKFRYRSIESTLCYYQWTREWWKF